MKLRKAYAKGQRAFQRGWCIAHMEAFAQGYADALAADTAANILASAKARLSPQDLG